MYLESNTPSAVIKSQEIDGLEEWLKKNKPTVIPHPNTYPFQYKCHKC